MNRQDAKATEENRQDAKATEENRQDAKVAKKIRRLETTAHAHASIDTDQVISKPILLFPLGVLGVLAVEFPLPFAFLGSWRLNSLSPLRSWGLGG